METPEVTPLRDDVQRLRSALDSPLAAKLSSASELARAVDRRKRATLPTAAPSFDALLGGGLERGKLVELTGRRSTGRFALVMSALSATTQCGEAAALIDLGDGFDPQLGERAGIDLKRLLWVRPQSVKHAVMSAELLITTGFPLVVVDLGLQLRGRRVHDAAWVRLARAAEAHGAALLVSSPWPVSGTAADTVVSGSRSRAEWQGSGAMPRLLAAIGAELRVEKLRGHAPGRHEALVVASPDTPRRQKRVRSAEAALPRKASEISSQLVEGGRPAPSPPSLGNGTPPATRSNPKSALVPCEPGSWEPGLQSGRAELPGLKSGLPGTTATPDSELAEVAS